MKQLLMIYTCFSPENAIGSIRTTKLAKYLVRNGYRITLLSPEIHDGMMLDDGLDCPELNMIKRIYVPYGTLFKKVLLKRRNSEKLSLRTESGLVKTVSPTGAVRTILRRSISLLRATFAYPYTLIKNLSWFGQVRKTLRGIDGHFNYALSSYPSISSHWGCQYAKKIGLASKWIADFRDPLTYEHSGIIKILLNSWMLRRICADADKITIISKAMVDRFPRGKARQKLCYLPNGFDPEDNTLIVPIIQQEPSTRESCLTFVYTGGLYAGKRDLSPLFRALGELIGEGELISQDVKFIYAGNDFKVLQSQASFYKCSDLLENKGYVSHHDAIALQQNSDIAVVCTHNTKMDRGILTGKIYEYFQNSKQILAIVNGDEPGSELGEMIKESNYGYCFEEASAGESYSLLKNYIVRMLYTKKNTGLVPTYHDEGALEKYQYPNIVRELIKVLD